MLLYCAIINSVGMRVGVDIMAIGNNIDIAVYLCLIYMIDFYFHNINQSIDK